MSLVEGGKAVENCRKEKMMKKIFSILFALVLALSFSLVAVPAVEANTTASSTMIFEGSSLTDQGGGVYTGTIPMTPGTYYAAGGAGYSQRYGCNDTSPCAGGPGGFDVYAKRGGTAYVQGVGSWSIGTDCDAYSESGPWGTWYTPDCADWCQYSLELTADHWYLRYTATNESPMSGVICWYGDGTGYAAETDLGTQDGSHDGSEAHGGGAQAWDWDCGWGVEVIPLELPGFAVEVTSGGSYTVTLTPAEGPVLNVDTEYTYGTIQLAITAPETLDGHTIEVDAGTYVEAGQIVINKNLTIIGANKDTTIIKPAQDTGGSGDARGWFLVHAGKQFNLSNVTLDGSGRKVYQAIRHMGSGTTANCNFNNIQFEPSGPTYQGTAMVIFGNGNVDVTGCSFTAIGRVGVLYYGTGVTDSTFSNNTYVGKGTGDWLDYGVEVGAGATAAITDNTITDCKGVASVDGSTSAGILVTTYYGPGTEATITGNTLTNNTAGIGVGYDEYDTSTVVAHYNNIYGNTDYGIDTTAPVVDALYNWWGDETGPDHDCRNPGGQGDAVSDDVDFSPWLYKTQEEFVSDAPCYAGSVVLANEATEVVSDSYEGGWNSFSTPVTLVGSANTASELLDLAEESDLYILRAQRFDLATQQWKLVILNNSINGIEDYQINPGEGFYIQVRSKGSLPILVKTTITSPPMRNLVAGWNLIGLSSLEAQKVATALTGVSYSMVLSPKPPNDVAWSVPPYEADAKELLLGKAYWVAMGEPGILYGFTLTPVASDMTWKLNQ
jgi:hypothetical protein